MEACFRHGIKNKKDSLIATFYLTVLTFCLAILSLYLADLFYSQNCEFTSCIYYFFFSFCYGIKTFKTFLELKVFISQILTSQN